MKTKSLFLIFYAIALLFFTESFGQVGIGTSEPDSSAALDINSTNQGLLIPRLTTTQIFYIDNPAIGLIAFNLDSLDFWYFNGTKWIGVIDHSDTLDPNAWFCGFDISHGGQFYSTIHIGTQCWMAENLNIGSMINGADAQQNNGIIEKYCYNNEEDSCSIYGGLYQWNEMMKYINIPGWKGICPTGWHLPTVAEWTTLTEYLGGASIAGGKLKETSTIHWHFPNTGATNESGFTALPGGNRDWVNAEFNGLGDMGYWWSGTESGSGLVWNYQLGFDNTIVNPSQFFMNSGYSVRCIEGAGAMALPTVTTSDISDISQTTATGGGNVTDDGNPEGSTDITARGVCWKITGTPTISDNFTTDGTGPGPYTSNITGLSPNETYYVRAYATNITGTAYGNEVTFTTLINPDLPTLTTTSVTDITINTATSGGNITDQGISEVTSRGVCWNTTGIPTLSDSLTTDGAGTGSFTSYLTGLTANTIYFVRAYATNSAGTAYGNEMNFSTSHEPCPGIPTVSYDGQTYNTVLIGTQCWFKENLRTAKYRNGDTIPNVTDNTAWWSATGAYCWYDNDSTTYETLYGKLYNWHALNDSRGLCPTGWHSPTDAEWTTLITYLGGESVAGGKMKETSTIHWHFPNIGATNESGFTALPGGLRDNDCNFYNTGDSGHWWSASELGSSGLVSRYHLSHDNTNFNHDYFFKHTGNSVRCVKDE